MAQSEIRPLTGLRGVMACWVVVYHVHQEARLSGYGGEIVRHGYLAVDIFFILSGFVLALSYRHLFEAGFTGRSFAVFLTRRLARVWPLYAVTTLAYVAIFVAGFGSGRVSPSALVSLLPLNLAMVQAWGFGESINHPAWSISTEFAAYLLFPLFAWLVLFSRAAIAFLTSAVAMLILWNLPALSRHTGFNGPLDLASAGTVWPLVRCILEFVLGLATYRLATVGSGWRLVLHPVASWVLISTLLVMLMVRGTDLPIVALIPLLLLQLAHSTAGVARFLASSPILILGRVSYAIYLLHWSLLPLRGLSQILENALGPVAAKTVAECLLYTVLLSGAAVVYYTIEKPGRRWINDRAKNLYLKHAAIGEHNEVGGQAEANVHAQGHL